MEQGNTTALLVGMKTCTAILENNTMLGFFFPENWESIYHKIQLCHSRVILEGLATHCLALVVSQNCSVKLYHSFTPTSFMPAELVLYVLCQDLDGIGPLDQSVISFSIMTLEKEFP